jgi:cell division protein ZapA
MAQVTVKVNGYTYTVGCEDGQESHLQAMAAQVDSRVESIKALGGTSGESRLLLLVSLLMADEAHDLRAEVEALRKAVARAPRPAGAAEQPVGSELGQRLGKLAARAEEIAATLEQP